jgi:hypothetical protein
MLAAPILAATPAAPHPMSTIAIVFWIAVALFAYAGAYSVSVRRHPYRPCSKCGESGKHRGTLFTGSFRACNRCGGTGRELRLFAKAPGTGPHSGSRRAFEPGPDRTARRAARRDRPGGH